MLGAKTLDDLATRPYILPAFEGSTKKSIWLRPFFQSFWLNLAALCSVVTLIALIAWLVYYSGGTQFSTPYLILLPVIFAGAVFKIPGGLAAAFIAGLLLGPYMPLDTVSGEPQTLENWLIRLVLYLLIGAFTGALASALDASQRRMMQILQTDPGSGLMSSNAVRQLIKMDRLEPRPSHVVAIGFEGHDAAIVTLGSEIAHTVIGQLGRHLRAAHDGDGLATRIQGGTFCIVLPGGRKAVQDLIARCDKEVPQKVEVQGIPIPILLRFGVADLTESDREGPTPFRSALTALRTAMETGQRIAHYTDGDGAETHGDLQLLSEFRGALTSGACTLHYQPKMKCASNEIYGAEALIRWKSDSRGDISPGRFLPLVEGTLLINDLTRFVVDSAMQASVRWKKEGVDVLIALNLSMMNLEDESFIEYLVGAPAAYGVCASRFELELTETALMRRVNVAKDALDRLRNAGFVISIDDYGTGASSLRYLKELPIDCVKLDQSFVRDLPENGMSQEIAAATAAMCKGLRLSVIAEGVETEAALQCIAEQGFDAAQGYKIARPMPEADFVAWFNAFAVAEQKSAS